MPLTFVCMRSRVTSMRKNRGKSHARLFDLGPGMDAGANGNFFAKGALEAQERAALCRVKCAPSVDRQPEEYVAMILEQHGRTRPELNIVAPLDPRALFRAPTPWRRRARGPRPRLPHARSRGKPAYSDDFFCAPGAQD